MRYYFCCAQQKIRSSVSENIGKLKISYYFLRLSSKKNGSDKVKKPAMVIGIMTLVCREQRRKEFDVVIEPQSLQRESGWMDGSTKSRTRDHCFLQTANTGWIMLEKNYLVWRVVWSRPKVWVFIAVPKWPHYPREISFKYGDNWRHFQTFIVLHLVAHVKSDRNRCLINEREKLKPCVRSHLRTAAQLLYDMGVNVGLWVSESYRNCRT